MQVTDGDEKRPEESEPKAVCRFFTRGVIKSFNFKFKYL
jgi:hypothetical protein